MKRTAGIASLALAFCALFVYHLRPYAGEIARSFFSARDLAQVWVLPSLLLSFLLVAFLGAGFALVSVTFKKAVPERAGAALPLYFACGSGVLGSFLTALGLSAGFARVPVLAVLAVSFLFGLRFIYETALQASARKPAEERRPYSSLEIVFIAFLVWGLGMTFLNAFFPPYDVDSLSYHLAVPKLWLERGRLQFIPWIPQAQYPAHAEVLYGLAVAFGQPAVAQGLHWLFGASIVGLLLFWPEPALGRAARLCAASAFATLPVVTHFMWRAHNDMAMALYGFLFCLCLYRAEEGGMSWAVLSGLFGGWMCASRYQGVAFLFTAAAAAWLVLKPSRRRALPAAVAVALLVALPWYLKNLVQTGNPVWPYLRSLFPAPFWPEEFARAFDAYFLRGFRPLQWLQVDWLGSWRPATAPLAAHYFFLPLLALAALGRGRWHRFFVWAATCFAAYFLIVAPVRENWWRFLLVLLPAGCWLFGWLLTEAGLRLPAGLSWLKLACLTAFVPALFIRFRHSPLVLGGLRDVSRPGTSAASVFLERALPGYPQAWSFVDSYLPPSARVGLLRESQGFYLRRDYVWIDPLNQAAYASLGKSPEGVCREWAAMGLTHILFGPPYPQEGGSPALPGLYTESMRSLEAALAGHGRVIYTSPQNIRIFELDPCL